MLKALKIFALAIVLHLFMLMANKAFNHSDAISPTTISYKIGDSDTWTETDFDDSDWSVNLPDTVSIYWLRANFNLNGHRYPNKRKEIVISVLGSYEAYFDGMLIGQNGKVGKNVLEETPGQLDRKFILPDSLIKNGEGLLALRVSNHHLKNTGFNQVDISIDSYNSFYKYGIVLSLLLYTLAGIFLTVALYYFFLFFISHRKINYLIFGIFCFILFILIIQTYSRYYWPYYYMQYGSWLFISSMLSVGAAILLPIFLANSFQVPKKNLVVVSAIVLIVMAYVVFRKDETAPMFISVCVSTIIAVWAIFKKRFGSWEALTGLLIFLIGMMYFDLSLFVGFGVLVVANLFSLAVIQKEEKKKYEESLIRASRLKLQLLKKNLKPHFLINTLTNIVALIESKPKISIKLIEALSDEFYSLNEMTDKKLIPLEQEIKLCKSHLEVMKIRNDIKYVFNTQIPARQIMIPPAIVHTLLENGITHSIPSVNAITFDLSVEQKKKMVKIRFTVIGQFEKVEEEREGTGMAYIRSSLEENFPKKWMLHYGVLDKKTWQTHIEFAV